MKSHEEYLQMRLLNKKSELNDLVMRHMIAIAVHDEKKKMINDEIDSIENQLKIN